MLYLGYLLTKMDLYLFSSTSISSSQEDSQGDDAPVVCTQPYTASGEIVSATRNCDHEITLGQT